MKTQRPFFTFRLLPGRFAVLRLDPGAAIPEWALRGDFFSVTRTDDELSIVCRQEQAAPDVTCSADWVCLKLLGPFDFDETGVVAAVTSIIADEDIGVFVVSTFDGDHLLVKATDFPATVLALEGRGHAVDTTALRLPFSK